MKVQAQEEKNHAMKFFEFLSDRDERIALAAIEKPPVDFLSPEEVFKKALGHEKKVTFLINKLYELANKVEDNAAAVLLHWFINEQVEEEKNPTKILEDIKRTKSDPVALLMLDRELAKREG
jgi:ferritin